MLILVATATSVTTRRRRLPALVSQMDPSLLPGFVGVALMLLWAEHDGGFDQDTWYWGALLFLGLSVLVFTCMGPRLPRSAKLAICCLAGYVGWSFLSIIWASSPGDALTGSNRGLLYLLILTLFLSLPWTPRASLAALTFYALGVGALAVEIMCRLGANISMPALFEEGRLVAPTGYFNSSVALFTSAGMLATVLASRRDLPAPLRGLLLGGGAVCFQLALAGQSRGWLLTLPLVLLVVVMLSRNRFRLVLASVIPLVSALVPLHSLINLYSSYGTPGFTASAEHVGHLGLATFGIVFVVGALVSWAETRRPEPRFSVGLRRAVGAAILVLVAGAGALGALAATNGRPVPFIKQQLSGFTHEESGGSGSHFATVGSGRYDFWRVAANAFVSHPMQGIGTDNFADYYITRRRTPEDPSYPHSIVMSLLSGTGIVGSGFFLGFLVFALRDAIRGLRRRLPTDGAAARSSAIGAAALIPLVDWLIHGSFDWFFEIPALAGPALAFLAMSMRLATRGREELAEPGPTAGARPGTAGRAGFRWPARAATFGMVLAVVAATVVLGFPYLAVREVSTASDLRNTSPAKALSDVRLASKLNPLWAEPGRLGGTIALQSGRYAAAVSSFSQAVTREPRGWFAWYGLGLAQTQMGNAPAAATAFRRAAKLDRQSDALKQALRRVYTTNPVGPSEGLSAITDTPGEPRRGTP